MPAWRDVAARKIVGWPPLFFFCFFFCHKHRRTEALGFDAVATTAHGRRFKPRRVLGPQPPTCGDVLCWSRPQSGAGIYWQLVEAIFGSFRALKTTHTHLPPVCFLCPRPPPQSCAFSPQQSEHPQIKVVLSLDPSLPFDSAFPFFSLRPPLSLSPSLSRR